MAQAESNYYIPHGSHWPIVGSIAVCSLMVGFSNLLNGEIWGKHLMIVGVVILLIMLFGWFGAVIKESETGAYNNQVDTSFRWGMAWFIFSEVMFFAAFFGALFYTRVYSLPWLGGEGTGAPTNSYLWPGFEAIWPMTANGPGEIGGSFETMGAWGLPAINTALLLTSGVTLTWAHHALKANHRGQLIIGLFLTVLLGAIFMVVQSVEYAIILFVILIRCIRGHFKPEHHFGFEAAAWYWHFVDVVWLGLFIFVYWV